MASNQQSSGEATKRCHGKRKREHQDASVSSSFVQSSRLKDKETFGNSKKDVFRHMRMQIDVLNKRFSWNEEDRIAAKTATKFIVDMAQDCNLVTKAIKYGLIQALVKQLQAPPLQDGDDPTSRPLDHQVEEGSAHALGLIAALEERYQQLIVDVGALSLLVNLLNRLKTVTTPMDTVGVTVKAANCIQMLSRGKNTIRNLVRLEGGIGPLVDLLVFSNIEVQRAAALTLQELALENYENKNEIVLWGAFPYLVNVLRTDFSGIQAEAVGLISRVVHSHSVNKVEFLKSGALQPTIRLLSKGCREETKKEAATLIGHIVSNDPLLRIQIAQRGAIPPLVKLLKAPNLKTRMAASFTLGSFAEDPMNQVGIAEAGGLARAMRNLIWKKADWILENNSIVVIFKLLNNEDNIIEFVKKGGVQLLLTKNFHEINKIAIKSIFTRLEQKMHSRAALYLLHQMIAARKSVRKYVAAAFAHFCCFSDHEIIFLDHKGLNLLIEMLCSSEEDQQIAGARALTALSKRAPSNNPVEADAMSPTSAAIAERYINNPVMSDVTFLIEGKKFYADKDFLMDGSDMFRAMFDGKFRETSAEEVEIPDIKWDIFEKMIRFIYTGSTPITIDKAYDLLMAADRYLMKDLKLKCEQVFVENLSIEKALYMYFMAAKTNANFLKEKCVLFILENFEFFRYSKLVHKLIPDIQSYFAKALIAPPDHT